jgi:uncharacterized protein (DUF1810 family)
MAEAYGIGSMKEAKAYLAHPLLGRRLVTCTEAVLATERRPLAAIFGSPDDLKFHSSMTLFALAAGERQPIFRKALETFCAGDMDRKTLDRLREGDG